MPIIELERVSKTYETGELNVPVLHDVTLNIEEGEMVAIMGPSGSGKSTLMNMIGMLDRPSEGTIRLKGEEISLSMPDRRLAELRSETVGFVFQSFNLLPRATALANVLMPTMYRKAGRSDRERRAKDLLESLGLGDRIAHHPTEMSGGEKQRLAIARALINDPAIILADEPTGNLDSKNGREVLDILRSLNKKGKTVIIITHDQKIADTCDRIIHILDGKIRGSHA